MARIVLSERVRDDFDRIFDHVFQYAPESAVARIESIVSALDILETSPLIGRAVQGGQRELIIGSGSGFVALYRYLSDVDTVFVLAVRSQRESGYKR
ncbi:MAG TPA: type II toxin-antitoxin system RelE/ParE family toxin [Burkholderiaceae bacterium]|nr:type II toxin-antitoxin system RelE/ParE family toxin [Burkholderiaceae bacterium]